MNALKMKLLKGAAALVGVYVAARHGWLTESLMGLGFVGLTVPKTFPARVGNTMSPMYFRKTINFNDANVAAPTDPFGRLPINASIVDVQVEIVTVFNAVTTNVLTVGTTAASANEIVAAADVNEGATGVTKVTRGLGVSLTAAAEVNLYAKYTQSGTAATTGKAIVTILYIPDNDQ